MQRKRRSFGTIRKLPSGNYQVRYRDLSGKMHAAPHTFVLYSEASSWLSTAEADLRRGTWLDPNRAKVPFEELVLAWKATRPNLRASTAASYGSYLSSLLLPYFGGMRADQITVDTVRDWHKWASKKPRGRSSAKADPKGKQEAKVTPVSRNTVAKAYRILCSIMDVAVDDEIIARTPCRLRGVAADDTPEMQAASAEEIQRLCLAVDPRYQAMVLTACYGGLRLGELTGLRKHRIDWKENTIRVIEQVTYVRGEFVLGPPKTKAGVRTVKMPQEAMTALKAHIQEYGESGKNGLVFPSPKGGYIRPSNFRDRVWNPAREKAGLPGLRFHDLRHSHATLAVAAGIDLKTLMARMGQSSSRAALIYMHARSDQSVVNGFDTIIASAREAVARAEEEAAQAPSETTQNGTSVARNGLRAVE